MGPQLPGLSLSGAQPAQAQLSKNAGARTSLTHMLRTQVSQMLCAWRRQFHRTQQHVRSFQAGHFPKAAYCRFAARQEFRWRVLFDMSSFAWPWLPLCSAWPGTCCSESDAHRIACRAAQAGIKAGGSLRDIIRHSTALSFTRLIP